jgi:hypothetical protein
MIAYAHTKGDTHSLIQFFRKHRDELRRLKKVVVSPEKVIIYDINRDTMEFEGLTYGDETLDALLKELGVVYNPATLHNSNATPSGVKEYELGAVYPWGHDRIA